MLLIKVNYIFLIWLLIIYYVGLSEFLTIFKSCLTKRIRKNLNESILTNY
jgi:hypothetical protein